MNAITFDSSSRDFILNVFDKTTDTQGFIVERKNKKQRVLSPDGQEVHVNEFAGISKGSEIFIKNDLISLMHLCDSVY